MKEEEEVAVMTRIVGGRGVTGSTATVIYPGGATILWYCCYTTPTVIFLTDKHHKLAIVKMDVPLISQLFNYSCISQ